MSSEQSNAEYLTRREAQERSLAASAADTASRRVHLDLAERYAAQLRLIGTSPLQAA